MAATTKPEVIRRLVGPFSTALILFAVLVIGGLLYSSTGGAAREDLFTQLLLNAIIVIGMQVYIGNTGILSFGHVGFGAIAGYTFAVLAISVERKAVTIRNAPFGLSNMELHPMLAVAAAVAVTLVVALIVGIGLARTATQSGAIAATVITLAVLFAAHEVAINWDRLTGGARAGLSFSIGDTLDSRIPVYLALFGALVGARLYATSRSGRIAVALREDPLAARCMGHEPAVHQTLALAISVVIVAVGASLRVYQLGSITPNFFFFEFTLLTLTMLIIGGRNGVVGAVLGVVLITVGTELARYLAGPDVGFLPIVFRPGLTKLFLGLAMLLFMIFRPNGLLVGRELDSIWFHRWRRQWESKPEVAHGGHRRSGESRALQAEGLSVRFGGFQALGGVSITADPSMFTGIIGPNGAGKTTLLNVLTGVVKQTEGSFSIGSQDLSGLSTTRIARSGLVRTFQNLRLFPGLSVRENIAVATLARPDPYAGPTGEQLIVAAGLWDVRDRLASELDYGTARRLELARAAAAGPAFLLLDEPTSGMNEAESSAMAGDVRRIANLVDAGVVVVDHDLGFVSNLCDKVYCLAQGAVIATGTPEEVQADPAVRSVYLGEERVSLP